MLDHARVIPQHDPIAHPEAATLRHDDATIFERLGRCVIELRIQAEAIGFIGGGGLEGAQPPPSLP